MVNWDSKLGYVAKAPRLEVKADWECADDVERVMKPAKLACDRECTLGVQALLSGSSGEAFIMGCSLKGFNEEDLARMQEEICANGFSAAKAALDDAGFESGSQRDEDQVFYRG